MISASKNQHIIHFMSLLKVSLCINGPKQRLLCMDTRRGAGVSTSPPTPERTKTFFFAVWGNFFVFLGDFMSLWVFFMGLPLPLGFFCGRMPLCNLHPMSSAITYSGHYVPNKAHCNTRVQFTITMK